MKNWSELRYSLRVLLKTPGHTVMCVAIITMSLCIGIIALTLTYNLLYKPLEFTDGKSWVHLTRVSGPDGVSGSADTINSFHYQYLKDNATVFETVGAVRAFSVSRMNYGESATQVSSAEITPHIFAASGLQAHLGRSLLPSDSDSNNQIAVISYALWQNYFSADPDIVGKSVNFDEMPLTIVGVMPAGTAFGIKHDVWIANQSWLVDRPDANNIRTITPVGILKPGVSITTAQAELSKLTQQLKTLYPDFFAGDFDVLVSPFKQFLVESTAPIFIAVAVFSCFLVLLGIVNIANLLISRTIERQREFAIRNCVGSSRLDILRQSLLETLLLCGLALLLALPLTLLGMSIINNYFGSISAAQGFSAPPAWLLHLDLSLIHI